MREPPFVQGRHCRRWFPGNQLACRGGGFGLGLGGLAGLQSDRVRGHGPGSQSRGQAGDDMLVRQMTPQQGNLDQGPGAVPLAMDPAGLVPPSVVDWGEPAC